MLFLLRSKDPPLGRLYLMALAILLISEILLGFSLIMKELAGATRGNVTKEGPRSEEKTSTLVSRSIINFGPFLASSTHTPHGDRLFGPGKHAL